MLVHGFSTSYYSISGRSNARNLQNAFAELSDKNLKEFLNNLQNAFAELSDKNLKEFLNMDEAVHTDDRDIEIRLENENDTVEINDSEIKEDEVNDQLSDLINHMMRD
ncbi:hypothetical protein QE152_g31039 [Popillia japonica]|uniref:Uncharacterized protein n=1 Tax=Popillia japonica TaxID=7064 RepID=A0AAW1JD80_POPJA